MRRPLGVTAIAIYLCFDCAVSLGYAFVDFRSAAEHHRIPWLDLVFAAGFGFIAWGLFRLKEWARFTAMLVIAIWAGERLPLYLLSPKHFNVSYLLIVIEEFIDLFAVWYLFRFATAKHFSELAKNT